MRPLLVSKIRHVFGFNPLYGKSRVQSTTLSSNPLAQSVQHRDMYASTHAQNSQTRTRDAICTFENVIMSHTAVRYFGVTIFGIQRQI